MNCWLSRWSGFIALDIRKGEGLDWTAEWLEYVLRSYAGYAASQFMTNRRSCMKWLECKRYVGSNATDMYIYTKTILSLLLPVVL